MLTLDKSDIHYKINTDLKTWLENQAIQSGLSATDFLIKVIKDLKTGRLIDANTSKESRESAKLEIMKESNVWRIKKIKSDIIRNGAETNFKRALVEEYRNKNRKLPQNILKIENKLIEDSHSKNPIVRDGLMCIDCGIIFVCDFDNKEDVSKTSELYMNHVFSKHRKELEPEEEIRLIEIKEKFSLF